MREQFAELATELLEADPRTAIVLADISERLFTEAKRRAPERVISLGIREQLLISVTSGLAMEGLRPIAHTYAPFLVERPFEQIKLDLDHQDRGAILVGIGGSYDASREGRTHQAPGDVALLSTLPRWTIDLPGHPNEMDEALRAAVRRDDRTYLRLSQRSNARAFTGSDLHVLQRGVRGTVLAIGTCLDATLAACEGLDVTVLYTSRVRPFDARTLRATLGTPDVVIVEPVLRGTSAHTVTEALQDVPHRLLALGVDPREVRRYGTPEDHDRVHGLDAAGLRASITGFLSL